MNQKKMGILQKEKHKGEFIDKWNETFQKHSFDNVDVTQGFAEVLSVKDEQELVRFHCLF